MPKYHKTDYLIPDAFFTITFNKRRHHFLLEMDRGTVSAMRMAKRYQVYYEWWKQNGPKDAFGISTVRILTVTTGQKRMENLIKACYQVRPNNSGSALFWFTIAKYVDVFRPNVLLCRIWRKALPYDSSLYSLLD